MKEIVQPNEIQLADGRIYPKGVLWEKGKRPQGAGHKRKTEISQLNIKQRKFAEMLADVDRHRKTTSGQFAKILGICQATVYAWRRLRPVQDLALELYKNNGGLIKHMIPIQEAVASRAKQRGGSADARLYFDILKWMKVIDVGSDGGNGDGGNTFNVDKVLVIIQNENGQRNNG